MSFLVNHPFISIIVLMLVLNYVIKEVTRSKHSPLTALMLWTLSMIGQACSPFSGPVDEKISDSYYYSKNRKHIQYSPMGNWFELGNRRIEEADVKSFEVLDNLFAKDKHHIYYQHYIIDSLVDRESFRTGEYICLDKHHVFRPERYKYNLNELLTVIEGADPDTYEVIDFNWARDSTHYFYNDQLIDVDYTSFEVINEKFARDSHAVYLLKSDSVIKSETIDIETVQKLNDEYIKDNENIYYFNEYENGEIVDKLISIPYGEARHIRILDNKYLILEDKKKIYYDNKELEDVDFSTFEMLKPDFYAKDHASVYYMGKKLKDADPESFEIIQLAYYSKDKDHVYGRGEIIEGADAKTFRVVQGKYSIEYKDKNHTYKGNEIVD